MKELLSERLYIGDSLDAEDHQKHKASNITNVVTLSTETSETTHHRELIDGRNPQLKFNHAVVTVLKLLQSQTATILLHCSAGVSRTGAVSAAVLAVLQSTTYERALETVSDVKPNVNPHPDLEKQARTYLGEVP
jgi:atypical dual specificity phosphatase